MIQPRIKYFHISNEILYHKLIDKLGITDKKCIIFLNGNVGAGKTTFVKSFLSHKEYPIDVTSPTFTIVNEYYFDSKKIYHYDFYRLKNKNELQEIGIDYYLDQPGIHFVEWPENFIEILPKSNIDIKFFMLKGSRLVKVQFNNE